MNILFYFSTKLDGDLKSGLE